MNIVGINAYHGDASAALVQDGRLVAAVEEERFNRVKHWAGFPREALRWCLEEGGLRAADVDHVAVSFNPRANFFRRLGFVAKNRPSFRAIFDRIRRQGKTLGLAAQVQQAVGETSGAWRARFHRIEHHQTHAAAGFLISPYDEAAILSIDGMGDFCSLMTAHGQGCSWREISRVWYPHSLGFLYTAMTMYLGFPNYGDEYKVMGLAPYGQPEYVELVRKLIRPAGDTFALSLDYFHHQRHGIRMAWNEGAPKIEPFLSKRFYTEFGPARRPDEPLTARHENLARSLQVVTEEILMHVLNRLHARTKTPNLCLTGGVAMNSVANGKVTQQTPFEQVYVPAGAADNGTSFGAAFYVWNRLLGEPRKFVQKHAYWGCHFDREQCEHAIRSAGLPYEVLDEGSLLRATVNLLLEGRIVGWFQGAMEFGARALGNRSLLADPRRVDMRDIINARIKFRERFRPFAPSILEEQVGDWFEISEPTPYMEKVFPIRPERRPMIPAVTHVDGTGRLQTVSRETNPLYHALITQFFAATQVPLVLNTSLNENEPIVRTPAEALQCFLRTEMDALVLGPCLVNRHQHGFPAERRRVRD